MVRRSGVAKRMTPHAPSDVMTLVNRARVALGLRELRDLPTVAPRPDWEDGWTAACPLARAFPLATAGTSPVLVDWLPGLWGANTYSIQFPTAAQAKAVARAWRKSVLCQACVMDHHDPDSPYRVDDEPGPACVRDTVRLPMVLSDWVYTFDWRVAERSR
jgi:hypothetical protein